MRFSLTESEAFIVTGENSESEICYDVKFVTQQEQEEHIVISYIGGTNY